MAEFESVEPFAIDDGELDGLLPQDVFVMGYELGSIAAKAEHCDDGFGGPVKIDNLDRIRRFLDKRGRKHNVAFDSSDSSESWANLWVAPK